MDNTRAAKRRAAWRARCPGPTVLEVHGQDYVDRLMHWARAELAAKTSGSKYAQNNVPAPTWTHLPKPARAREQSKLYRASRESVQSV